MKISPLSSWIPNPERPLVIAGPCSAETEEQVLAIAKHLSQIPAVRLFRAGIWKPRTRPGTFEGVGNVGLDWLKKVKSEYGMATTVEVAKPDHAEAALKAEVDVLWIGARTSANPFAVQEIADVLKGVDIPVMVKNPINADLALWIGALERLNAVGIHKMAAVHRGFSAYENSHFRNPPLWKIPMELKAKLPELPVICDPSHIAGQRDLVPKVCQRAMDLNMDGLMIETHITPDEAWSDAAQQVTPEKLLQLLNDLEIRSTTSDKKSEVNLEEVRRQIDRLDDELLDVLKQRREVMYQVGQLKKDLELVAFDDVRMRQVLDHLVSKAEKLDLPPQYIRDIYHTIHEESVRVITGVMNQFDE